MEKCLGIILKIKYIKWSLLIIFLMNILNEVNVYLVNLIYIWYIIKWIPEA